MRMLLVVPLAIGATVLVASPASAATGCVSESFTIQHKLDQHRRMAMVQTTCIEETSAGAGYHATVSVRPAGEPDNAAVTAYLRVELHDCATGNGLSAKGYDKFVGVYEHTNWVPKTAYPQVYAQARVTSVNVGTGGAFEQWQGPGVFQSTAAVTC